MEESTQSLRTVGNSLGFGPGAPENQPQPRPEVPDITPTPTPPPRQVFLRGPRSHLSRRRIPNSGSVLRPIPQNEASSTNNAASGIQQEPQHRSDLTSANNVSLSPRGRNNQDRGRLRADLERELAEADELIRELEAVERRQRREREQERLRMRNPTLTTLLQPPGPRNFNQESTISSAVDPPNPNPGNAGNPGNSDNSENIPPTTTSGLPPATVSGIPTRITDRIYRTTAGDRNRPWRLNPMFPDLDREPITELCYQMSALTAELRNVRDVMGGLSDTIFTNSTVLETLAASNDEILNEIRNDNEE